MNPAHAVALFALLTLSSAALSDERTEWRTVEREPLPAVSKVTDWSSARLYVPSFAILRVAQDRLMVVLARPIAEPGSGAAAATRWRIAFERDDGTIVAAERIGSSAGRDDRGWIESTVLGVPAAEDARRIVAVLAQAPHDAEIHAEMAAVRAAAAEQERQVEAAAAEVALSVPAIGEVYDFSLERHGGGRIEASRLRGQPVLVEVWATWCAPCVRAAGEIRAARERIGRDAFAVVGISLDDDLPTLDAFVARHAVDWPQHVVGDAALGQATLRAMGFDGVPSYVLLDADGVVRRTAVGNELGAVLGDLERMVHLGAD